MNSEGDFANTFEGVHNILGQLRGPDGCPWDKEQTWDSLKSQFLEECYELVEAVEQQDRMAIIEELGDVLLHLVFQLHLGEESGWFKKERVFQTLVEKLIRRHPHVFGDVIVADAEEVSHNWEAIKRQERANTATSILDSIPKNMPALAYSQTIQQRAAMTGFDWENIQGVIAKVAEELQEMKEAESDSEREAELGDILFSIVNLARWEGLDAEGALRLSSARFYRRFTGMEKLSRERGVDFADLPRNGKEALWQEVKMSRDGSPS